MAKKKGKFQPREEEQIEAYYNQMAGTPNKKKPIVTVIITLCVLLLVSAGVLGAMVYFNDGAPMIVTANTTMESGVTIAGVSVGGMNKEEAMAAVNAAVGDIYASQPMTVTVLDQTMEIAPAVSGAQLDVEKAVRDAFACGTADHPQLQLDIAPYLTLNEGAIRNEIQELGQNFPTEGTQSAWEVVGSGQEEVLKLTIGTNYYVLPMESDNWTLEGRLVIDTDNFPWWQQDYRMYAGADGWEQAVSVFYSASNKWYLQNHTSWSNTVLPDEEWWMVSQQKGGMYVRFEKSGTTLALSTSKDGVNWVTSLNHDSITAKGIYLYATLASELRDIQLTIGE